MSKLAKPGYWCNADVARTATVVTASGVKASGVIVRWTGPAECVLDNGSSGVLLEAANRRENNKS